MTRWIYATKKLFFVSGKIQFSKTGGEGSSCTEGQGHFVYGKKFSASKEHAFAFDPINLTLSNKQQKVAVYGDGAFGALSDAGPNSWGKRVTSSICVTVQPL